MSYRASLRFHEKYDTLDKCITLARSMDLDISQDLYTLAVLRDSKHSHDISSEDCEWCVKDAIIWRCMDEIAVRLEKSQFQENLKLFTGENSTGTRKWFVTIGFDDSVVTDGNEVGIINRFVSKLIAISGIEVNYYVVEKFREGGSQIHRHIHCLISTEFRKSKIVQYIFQKVEKIGKDKLMTVKGKNFIDVKIAESRHEKYIKGDKIPEKMECVKMDSEWRKKKGIKEYV